MTPNLVFTMVKNLMIAAWEKVKDYTWIKNQGMTIKLNKKKKENVTDEEHYDNDTG